MAWCAYCRSPVEDQADSCSSCGKQLSDGAKVIRCPACNKLILKSAKLCKYCGASLAEQAPVEQPDEAPSDAGKASPVPPRSAPAAKPLPKKKKRFPWLVIPLLLVLCATAAVFFFRHRQASSDDSADPKSYMVSCKSVAYSMLMHDPGRYAGTRVTFSGRVLRVLEGGTVHLHLTQFNPVVMGESDVWAASYVLQDNEAPFSPGDELTVYGECRGAESYRNKNGETVTIPVIEIAYWGEADLERLAAGQDPVFGVGETWTIDGLCSLTVTSVKALKAEGDLAAKYLVDYSYTNLGYQTETADGIYVAIDEIILDSAGMMGYRLPAEVKKQPGSTPVGQTCEAQCCVGLEHAGAFQLSVSIYDENYNAHTARLNLSAE